MKKTYGVAGIDQKEYVESAGEQGGSSAVTVPLLQVSDGGEGKGFNAKIIAGEFALPPAKECQEQVLEVAHRILGILVTKDLLGHLPSTVTGEHVGSLLPFYPFSYHKRFGATYSDRVCPGSTRTGRCPVCDGRRDLFTSDKYKNREIEKDSIMKAGFGTKQTALVISRVFFNGEDMGIRAWTTALTNEMSANAKHDNFFDLIAQLTTPKKLLASETLPADYYSNGDGARWLIAEYVRATYQEDEKKAGDQQKKRAAAPYWKLSKVTPTRELPKVGKACDIWWPEFGKGKDATDGITLVDVYGLINHTPAEELAKVAKDSVDHVMNPKKRGDKAADDKAEGEEADEGAQSAEQPDQPAWADIITMETDELVRYGVAKGGKARDLELTGTTNIGALRRVVAKMWGVTPKPTGQAPAEDPDRSTIDEARLPF